jgi:hypothetical protein
MYNIIFIILLLIATHNVTIAQSKTVLFSYYKLGNDTIQYTEIQSQYIQKRKNVCVYVLDTIRNFKIGVFDRHTIHNSDKRSYIELNHKKYIIDKLFYGISLTTSIPLELNFTAYEFTFNEKKFISLFFSIFSFSSANQNTFVILFDVTNIKTHKLLLTSFQEAYTPLCFGDFNKDGLLDFFAKSKMQDYNSCYYFENDKKKLHKNITLHIIGSPFSPKIIPSKSKWFFDLSKK